MDINAAFHVPAREYPAQARMEPLRAKTTGRRLRVAIIGSGPAAMYAADELLTRPGVEVTIIERLPTPYGLVRHGVAPDHPETKTIQSLFARIDKHPRLTYFLGVEVGTDITHQEVAAAHDAVLYATGASRDRSLGIPGEDLTGSHTATEFVAWYNGHPDYTELQFDFNTERAVIVGNGNVALDVARILTTDPRDLACTDIADHALEALHHSRVQEVVVLGRRGPAQASFTLPEITGLLARCDVRAENALVDAHTQRSRREGLIDPTTERKIAAMESVPAADSSDGRRIVFRFCASPLEYPGDKTVEGVRLGENELIDSGARIEAEHARDVGMLPAGLILRSVGYRGSPVPGVRFDDDRAVIPNTAGRVEAMPGVYAVGWIKRGPSGYIGTNKSCAKETIEAVIADFNAGMLEHPARSKAAFNKLVRERSERFLNRDQWRRLDWLERAWGQASGRPRRKLTDRDQIFGLWQAS